MALSTSVIDYRIRVHAHASFFTFARGKRANFHLTEMLCYQLQSHKLHQNLILNHCAKAPS